MNIALRVLTFSLALSSWLVSPTAEANQMRYNLAYYNQEVSAPARPGVIHLKQAIQQVYGDDVDARGDRLVRVIMYAKSRAGFGRARLSVNGEEVNIPMARGNGDPNANYYQDNPGSYNEIHFSRINPEATNGAWMIQFQGAIKIQSIFVVTRDNFDYPPPGHGFSIRDLHWSSAGPNGRFCTQFLEPSDPHTWTDNYLCSDRDYGFRFSNAGQIPGMHCLSVNESADPNTWSDNYLCSPRDYGLVWATAGAIPGMSCIQILEAADPHTWNDNFLCSYR